MARDPRLRASTEFAKIRDFAAIEGAAFVVRGWSGRRGASTAPTDRNLGGLRSTDHRLGTRRRRVDHLELQQLFPPVDAPPVDRVAGRAELLHPLRLAVVGVNLV